MNYIKHLNKTLELFYEDKKLRPTHISLYMALFQCWNQNRFTNPIQIHRNELMEASKISSFSTYTECIKDLMAWGYIDYIPSFNPSRASQVHLYTFCTGDCKTECTGTCTQTVQPSVQQDVTVGVQLPIIYKHNKHNKHGDGASPRAQGSEKKIDDGVVERKVASKSKMEVPSLLVVRDYFRDKGFAEMEADKFFNYFESNGWRVGGRAPMKDWHAAARNWVLNAERFGKPKPVQGNIEVRRDKDYSEPL